MPICKACIINEPLAWYIPSYPYTLLGGKTGIDLIAFHFSANLTNTMIALWNINAIVFYD